MNDYPHIRRVVFGEPWLIAEDKLLAIAELVEARVLADYKRPDLQFEARKTGRLRRVSGRTAVLPVFGVLSQRMNMMNDVSGGTSTELLGQEFDAAVADKSIGAIVLDVDSPGGSVFGIQALTDKIYAARGSKPIMAIANSMAASAAYWLATAADEIVVAPGGEVGGIGTVALHRDVSAAAEKEGVKFSVISAGKFKGEGNPYEPLGDEARAFAQKRVDEHYDAFVKGVARNRSVSPGDVSGGFGQGRVLGAADAIAAGMADRIGTLESVLEKFGATPARDRAGRALRLAT